MISIIIPVYNQAKHINRCLNSIFNQTVNDLEVIVVDDGSTDNLSTVLAPWLSRIKLYRQENKGAPAARNFGYHHSQGEYLLFCDADIILKPHMLEKMLKILRDHPHAAYVYSSFRFGWKKFKLWPFDSEKLQQMPYIHTTSLLRRESFPGFDERLKKFQDWDLWLNILAKGRGGVWINEVLFHIKSSGTMSHWVPKIFYKLPVRVGRYGQEIEKYNAAKEVIQTKHQVSIKIDTHMIDLVENNAVALSTIGPDGNPRCVAVGFVKVIGDNKLLITNNFLRQTIKNIQKHPIVALAVWNRYWENQAEGYEFRGRAEYFTTGQWHEMVKKMPENAGLDCHGALLVTISDIKRLA